MSQSDDLHNRINKALSNLNKEKSLLVAISCSADLFKYYKKFHTETCFKDTDFLNERIEEFWKAKIENIGIKLDYSFDTLISYAPDSELFNSNYTNPACNTVTAISIIGENFISFGTEDCMTVVELTFEHVEMHLTDLYADAKTAFEGGAELEKFIKESALMLSQLHLILELIEYVGKMNRINKNSLNELKSMIGNKGTLY